MKNKIIEITSKIKKDTESVNDTETDIFDLGDLFLPPISFEELSIPKVDKENKVSNVALDFIPIEAKGALWRVEIPSINAILSCNQVEDKFSYELSSNGNLYLFNEVQEVLDFLFSYEKREKQNTI